MAVVAPMEAFVESLRAVDYVPLLLALLCGGAIGLERELSGRPAGVRTHILVCLCSTLLIMIARQAGAAQELPDGGRLVFDPNRMGAGIVTGIGFLGAATVIRSADLLRGLTTAACIWYVAGLGIVLGQGFYAEGVVTTLMVLLLLTQGTHVTHMIRPVVYRRLVVRATLPDVEPLMEEIGALLKERKIRVIDIGSTREAATDEIELVYYVRLKNNMQAPMVVQRTAALAGVTRSHWSMIR
jgi:putative Mg2+ transporter-C (MgtC) family protein